MNRGSEKGEESTKKKNNLKTTFEQHRRQHYHVESFFISIKIPIYSLINVIAKHETQCTYVQILIHVYDKGSVTVFKKKGIMFHDLLCPISYSCLSIFLSLSLSLVFYLWTGGYRLAILLLL